MDELIKAVLAVPIANLLVIAGLVFLGIAAVGNISGTIRPDKAGRIACGMLGAILLVMGLVMQPPQPGPAPTKPPVLDLATPTLAALTTASILTPSPVSSLTPTATATTTPTCAFGIAEFGLPRRTPQPPARFGCPIEEGTMDNSARQPFERGTMYWRDKEKRIYVLFTDKNWTSFDDTWDTSQPADSCPDINVPAGMTKPTRGFGKVWCKQTNVRTKIGAAMGTEYTPIVTGVQRFVNGRIFVVKQAEQIYALYEEGKWEEYRDGKWE